MESSQVQRQQQFQGESIGSKFQKYSVKHRTTYEYAFPVSVSYQNLHLCPRDLNAIQEISDYSILVDPITTDLTERVDFFGNYTHSFSIQEYHEKLIVETQFQAKVNSTPPPISEISISNSQVRNALHGQTSAANLQALQYIYPSQLIPSSPDIEAWTTSIFPEKRPFLEGVKELCERLYQEIEFDPTATETTTTVDEFFRQKKGVCQDYAHLMISCLRSQDLPARYVSGYILTIPREGEERLEGADASHAWVSVYVPGFGWVDFDPTNNLLVNDQHIQLAVGRDFSDISLIKGSVVGGGDSNVNVEVTVSPVPCSQQQMQFQSS